MSQDIINRLKQMQSKLELKDLSFQKLIEFQTEVKKAFDDKFKQLLSDKKFLKKIEVPQNYIKLWKHKEKRVKIPINWKYLISAPFIYGMIFPAIIWHIGIEIYQQVCFRFYVIPRVNPRDYFIFDRKLLSCLRFWERVNCKYCSYVNNLIAYSAEIGGRTERYWCPIKYYRKIKNQHSQYPKFISSNDSEKMREEWEELRNFSDLKNKQDK